MRIGRLATLAAAMIAGAASIAPASAATAEMPGVFIAAQQPEKKPLFDLRLRSLTATAPSTSIVSSDSQLRHRLIGSMMDFFPLAGSGFFLSGGGQLATRAAIVRDVNSSLARLLSGPRTGGLRASNKISPAATFGYVEGIGRKMELRLEGGALLGRMNYMNTGLPRGRGLYNAALGDGGVHAVNGVMRASFGMRF